MPEQQQRRQTIDPAVADILGNLDRKQSDARLPKAERKKKQKEREKNEARKGARASYDLPPKLIRKIAQAAEEAGCPASQVAALLLAEGLRSLNDGKITFEKTPSNSPRYDYNLVIEIDDL